MLLGLLAPAVRQRYSGVENKQITEHCHKHSALVISTCQKGFPKLPVVYWEGCPIAYLPLQQRDRDSALSMKVRQDMEPISAFLEKADIIQSASSLLFIYFLSLSGTLVTEYIYSSSVTKYSSELL